MSFYLLIPVALADILGYMDSVVPFYVNMSLVMLQWQAT